jgi:hypothetical protein
MSDQHSEPGTPKTSPISRPRIGMAICACLFFVSVITGYFARYAPSADTSDPSPIFPVALFLACASAICGLVYVIWFIVLLIKASTTAKD